MKRRQILAMFLAAAGGLSPLAGQEVETRPDMPVESPQAPRAVPEKLPLERYQALWERSPFELAVASGTAEPTGIAAEWLLASLSRINGQPVAVLANKSTGESAVVRAGSSNPQGLQISTAEIASDYTKSRVVVTRGSERAELVFQEQELSTLVAGGNAGGGSSLPPNMPAVTLPPGTVRPSPAPGQPVLTQPNQPPRPPRRIIVRPKPITPPSP